VGYEKRAKYPGLEVFGGQQKREPLRAVIGAAIMSTALVAVFCDRRPFFPARAHKDSLANMGRQNLAVTDRRYSTAGVSDSCTTGRFWNSVLRHRFRFGWRDDFHVFQSFVQAEPCTAAGSDKDSRSNARFLLRPWSGASVKTAAWLRFVATGIFAAPISKVPECAMHIALAGFAS